MSFSFPKAEGKTLGYEPSQVDAFIAAARAQFSDPNAHVLEAAKARTIEFDLIPGGYSTSAVDSAIDRLEDTFVQRELAASKAVGGNFATDEKLQQIYALLQGRANRPKRNRFRSSVWPVRGYSRKQVDALTERVLRHTQAGAKLTLTEVRSSVFEAKRGGYAENQVDAFIDRVIEALQLEQAR